MSETIPLPTLSYPVIGTVLEKIQPSFSKSLSRSPFGFKVILKDVVSTLKFDDSIKQVTFGRLFSSLCCRFRPFIHLEVYDKVEDYGS